MNTLKVCSHDGYSRNEMSDDENEEEFYLNENSRCLQFKFIKSHHIFEDDLNLKLLNVYSGWVGVCVF